MVRSVAAIGLARFVLIQANHSANAISIRCLHFGHNGRRHADIGRKEPSALETALHVGDSRDRSAEGACTEAPMTGQLVEACLAPYQGTRGSRSGGPC